MYDYKNSKNLAFTLIILFTIFLLYFIYPFLIPIFLGITVGYLFFPLYTYLLKRTKRESLSSLITIISVLLILVIPISLTLGLIFNQINNTNINIEQINSFETQINSLLGTNLSVTETTQTLKEVLVDNFQTYSQEIFSITTTFFLGLFIFFFTLFYSLIENQRFLKTGIKYLPFSKKNSKHVIVESGYAIKALLIGQVLTAVIQGTLGMISFFIAGIQGAFFWGIIMIILSLIPVVGSFIVWVPAGVILIYQGDIGMGIFILLWGFLIVSQIDNIVRPKLVNRFFKLHPLLVLIGVFAGLSLFGMVGLILGPLFFAFFILLLQAYEKEYGVKETV